jgi:hypothetical protein|tara:strand:- start:431 stop:658 length:228 start_codon:yes stop_codon:yes gene_type:complete
MQELPVFPCSCSGAKREEVPGSAKFQNQPTSGMHTPFAPKYPASQMHDAIEGDPAALYEFAPHSTHSPSPLVSAQ